MIYKRYIKRIIDLILSITGLLLLSPVFLLIIIFIKFDSKGPILFKQLRVGTNKVQFYIYKFRTMRTDAPKNSPTWMLENPDTYITKVGKFLRKTSLDELPQIINIIKGEMSIIGPRPIIKKEYDLYMERDKNGVYSIKPGLTGLAQISGRDLVSFKEKASLDGEYVKNISFLLDFKIFLLTIIKVLKSDGVKEGVHKVKHNNSDTKERLLP
ncbi:sugar transferase [Neobacillus sp. YX16]|uniref:sugar transferase n=1 Tax=Neobacillus sp. YX16 TaxID=3047874 RepID=UPI0024C371A7|nr:sugar transferase [Neobacillus sp. YX16]WHZ02855.1 sugar transferase [Neobacillus sp. YX16]